MPQTHDIAYELIGPPAAEGQHDAALLTEAERAAWDQAVQEIGDIPADVQERVRNAPQGKNGSSGDAEGAGPCKPPLGAL